jgi:putative phosphoesterase
MDDASLRAGLPLEQVVEIGGTRIGLVHIAGPAAGRADRLVRRFPGCAVVVYGHTHLPELTRHGEVWILNPGSPTERRRGPRHTMLRLALEGGRVHPELVEVR